MSEILLKMYIGLHVKYTLFLSDFNYTWIFSIDFQKSSTVKFHFKKIRPVGAELFHEDGPTDGRADKRTDMTKLIVAFRNFANAPKNECSTGSRQ
jgi:hypothetical protein